MEGGERHEDSERQGAALEQGEEVQHLPQSEQLSLIARRTGPLGPVRNL